MKIGLFTDSYAPLINGVTTHVSNLKKGLEKHGHEVHVFCPKYPNHNDKEGNIHRFPTIASTEALEKRLGLELGGRIPLPPLNDLSRIISRLDILHSHHMFAMGRYASFYSRRHKTPLIFTNHTNYQEFETILPLKGKNLRRIISFFLQNYTDKCNCIISPGKRMKQLLIDYGVYRPIVVIPNGVSLSTFLPISQRRHKQLKDKLGILPQDQVLAYVGRLSQEKNLVFLLRALGPLLLEKSNLKLLIVGDGPIKNQIQLEARLLGITNQIILPGFISPQKVHQYYSISDLFVTTSMSEVFPLTIIEALSSSLPVVAINAPGTGDTVESGINGILAKNNKRDYAKAVKSLLRNNTLRVKMSTNARKSVKKFSIDRCVQKHLSLYQKYFKVK
jgi:glycosyltransferase involved in cell wall biosynthesis